MMSQSEHTLILIVDDNPTNCELLHRRLTRQGYSCEVAYGGKQMLELLEHTRPNLILLDLMMPEMDGLEVLRIIRESYSSTELPVLMVTAKNAREDVVSAFEVGANDYIEKPIDFPVLLARLKHQLEHKRLQDETRKSRAQLKERNAQWQKAHQQKNDLLKTISDELRAPITRILQDLDKLSRGLQSTENGQDAVDRDLDGSRLQGNIDNQRAQEIIDHTRNNATYLNRIAADLQDLANLESGQLELKLFPADLHVLINDVVNKAERDAYHCRVKLTSQIDEDIGVVECDPVRLQQILANLIGHSLNRAPKASTVTFDVSLTASGSIRVAVQDIGPLISELQPEMYFSHSAVPRATGIEASVSSNPLADQVPAVASVECPTATGLALYLVSKLVALTHGFMEIQSSAESGNQYVVYLPHRPVSLSMNS